MSSRPTQSMPRLFQAMRDAFTLPDLRGRIIFTIAMLVIFRLIAHVPLPGVDLAALNRVFQNIPLLGMLDLFSGGALRRFSIAAMGVYPYITAQIIMQILTPVIPQLQALSMEGESGYNRINTITNWVTIPLAALEAYGQISFLRSQGAVTVGTPLTLTTMVISMIAGTVFLMWLGELITDRGIGNGISLIIFAGIIAGYPQTIGQAFLTAGSSNYLGLLVYLIIALATVVVIVYFTEAHRRIPVQYAKSVFRGGRMYKQSGSTHIPLRVNTAGMIPLIFAMSMVLFPGVIASYFQGPASAPNFANTIVNWFNPNAGIPIGFFYWGFYFLLTIGFTFFYTMVIFQQQDLPGVLQKQGGFIPGIRPGPQTKKYLDSVIGHITWAGAIYLGVIAVIPFLAQNITGIQLQFSSIGLIIVIGVVLDTMKQLEAQLVMRRYEGFIK